MGRGFRLRNLGRFEDFGEEEKHFAEIQA